MNDLDLGGILKVPREGGYTPGLIRTCTERGIIITMSLITTGI